MEKWKGKYALVTGAAMGIGAAITTALIHHGKIKASVLMPSIVCVFFRAVKGIL